VGASSNGRCANFNGATIEQPPATVQSTGGISLSASNVKLDGASLQGATINHVEFWNSSAVGADFTGLSATVANFQ
jgi:uncharacterized protein YjbI with pentapeptide repeats